MQARFTPRHLLALGLLVFTANLWLSRLFLMTDLGKGLLAGVGIGLEILALYWAIQFRSLRAKGRACNGQPE